MSPIPFMILCDSIAGNTGLARVGRDLATRTYRDLSDTFRVGVLGVGGPISTSSRFPFPNYSIIRLQQMVPLDLPDVWRDFAGDERGILLVIWNLSWTQWLAQPWTLPPSPLRDFLLRRPESVSQDHWTAISNPSSPSFSPALLQRLADRPFQTWFYCPVDGNLPDGTLGHQLAPLLQGFDRLLCYTRYGSEVVEKTLEKWTSQSAISTVGPIPHLPHGLDRAIFHPRGRALARQTFFSRATSGLSQLPLLDDQILLCMCGTNSSRKCWDTFFSSAAILLSRGLNVFLWGHTDMIQPHPSAPAVCWNLPALMKQYGLDRRVCLTTARLPDDDLAFAYSAADCMIAVSSEGFGYAPFEALACGLPVVGTSYAGSAEFTPPAMRVDPVAYASEQPFSLQRPIYSPADVADRVQSILSAGYSHTTSLLDPKYNWDELFPRWAEWLKAGIQ